MNEKINSKMIRVLFLKDEFYEFYVEDVDEDSDMQDVYYSVLEYFGDNKEYWRLRGPSIKKMEQFVFDNIWPYDEGDFLIHRWLNSGLAIIEK